ncbi:uncharacterized protein LOC124616779 [Schistocerca americana]|uniref:uncharacterized protein LOC124616779 n=1 Tax=Schistocerca americana TaxID=7009 RepID=UPI001F4F25C4|nr:uncharacterized protein LOC124616779 [Schistocerca americana]
MFSVRQGVGAAVSGGRAYLATRAAALEDGRLEAPAMHKEEFRRRLEQLTRRKDAAEAAPAGRVAAAAAAAPSPRLPDSNEWAPAGHRDHFSSRASSDAASTGHAGHRLPDSNEWAPSRAGDI